MRCWEYPRVLQTVSSRRHTTRWLSSGTQVRLLLLASYTLPACSAVIFQIRMHSLHALILILSFNFFYLTFFTLRFPYMYLQNFNSTYSQTTESIININTATFSLDCLYIVLCVQSFWLLQYFVPYVHWTWIYRITQILILFNFATNVDCSRRETCSSRHHHQCYYSLGFLPGVGIFM